MAELYGVKKSDDTKARANDQDKRGGGGVWKLTCMLRKIGPLEKGMKRDKYN